MTNRYSQLLIASGFFGIVAVLPILQIESWGNSYSEPKYVALFCLAIFSTVFCFPQIIKHQISLPGRSWSFGFLAFLTLQIFSLQQTFNQGVAWQSLGLSIALLLLPLVVQSSTFDLHTFSKVLLAPIAVLLIGALAMILFRIVLFSDYSPFGSAIGLKNSLSVFLAQTIPFLLLLSDNKGPIQKRWLRYLTIGMLTLCFWVIFASRTRSAWWMIAFYLAALFVLYRIDKNSFRTIFLTAIATLASGLVLLLVVPNTLVWRSTTPYLSSLSSMISMEQSSGRKELWQVALEIINRHPLQGIGVGQYSVLWKDYIQYTKIDPKLFSFLREDLPLFNDYLQHAVESGIIASVIFSLLCFGLPFGFLVCCIRKKCSKLTVLIPLLVCCATALNACFDYPFNRPETVMLYATSFGFFLREYCSAQQTLQNRSTQYIIGIGLLCAILALSLLTTQMYLGLSARKHWHATGNLTSLETAFRYWPWDIQWKHKSLDIFLRKNDISAATNYVGVRTIAWPHDPLSHLLQAKLFQHQQDFENATSHYQQAVVQVRNGNCFRPGFEHYTKLKKQLGRDFPSIDIATCQ